jgi:hypothetical protein
MAVTAALDRCRKGGISDMMGQGKHRIAGLARLAAIAGVLAWAGLSARPAEAGPLVTDGTFLATSTAYPGGYLCNNTIATTCSSQLTDWSATCAKNGCGGSSSPSSILFAGSNGSAFNGGRGLYWTDASGNLIGNAPGNSNIIAMDGDTTYTTLLSQVINNLTIGDSYILTFYQAASQQKGSAGATTEQFGVSLGGGVTQYANKMNDTSGHAVDWQLETLTFMATARSEMLQFASLGTPNGEPPVALLADVSLTVPEPAELALFMGGVLVLTVVRRRRASRIGAVG